ncbi:anhydro-N-acetylmuramic acid kinase [Robertkochia aurantiaca]|uniref:anhydro-N-acetylmuramic acid kinase n=1 Tax=Robertkochia aurantiaca TaxID=2873700 RepID=UPI001CCC0944|nr:anhydro-N-acetylmuramic acid kinase [Robertkochia sp. 3YJGBD-33]
MEKSYYNVIGVMSGTSLDGIDLAEISLYHNGGWDFEIHRATTVPYPADWENKLRAAVNFNEQQLEELDRDYTDYLTAVIAGFLKGTQKTPDAVCSHGHTILHKPEKGVTLQIGNRPELASNLSVPVVCDFRVQDVALGGQGAPLVPIGDEMLFADYDNCLNLGGFANISTVDKGTRIAWDICAVNTVMNHYALRLGKPYDEGGKFAARGSVDKELMGALDNLEFYSMSYPKSLGIEWVEEKVFPLIDGFDLPEEVILRTYVEHIAKQIGKNLLQQGKTLVTGGGAYNSYLLKRMHYYSENSLVVPEPLLVEYKEALIFALLGVLRLRNEVNCLSSVTGAEKDHSSGMIYLPDRS